LHDVVQIAVSGLGSWHASFSFMPTQKQLNLYSPVMFWHQLAR
jgi:hypothetical protein